MTISHAGEQVHMQVHHNGMDYLVRSATPADVPFLAWVQYEASLPPANYSFWDGILGDLGIEGKSFIETVLTLNAGAWGSVPEFIILEHDGKPVGAAAGVEAGADFAQGPVRVSRIGDIGATLGWSAETTQAFRMGYEENWPDPEGNFILLPQAPWIIESVAIVPEARGKGLVNILMNVLLEEGRRRGHHSVGISVANGNEPARLAYERLGFQMYVAFGPAFFGEDGFGGYTKYKMAL